MRMAFGRFRWDEPQEEIPTGENRRFHQSALTERITDALILGASFYLSYQIRFDGTVPPTSAYQMWLLLPVTMLGHVLVGSLTGLYRLIWRYISLSDALLIFRAYVVLPTILLVLRLGLPDRLFLFKVPLGITVIGFFLSLNAALCVRMLTRILYQRRVRGDLHLQDAGQLVLIGAGQAGAIVAKELAFCPDLKPICFLDDDPNKLGRVICGIPVLGPVASLPSIVEQHRVKQVIICIARPSIAVLKQLWALCEGLQVQAKIVPTLEEILLGKVNIAAFRDFDMAELLGRKTAELSLKEAQAALHYRGRRVLITGAGGSIGSELARQLVNLQPESVVLLDKDENGLHELLLGIESKLRNARIHPVVADLRFPERLQALFARFRPEVVFHAAAHKHVHLMEMNPAEAILSNVVGTRNLIEQSVEFGISRFVLISTDKAVKPASVMGASKRVCEMLVQAQGRRARPSVCCVRLGNVLGSRGSVVPIFRRQIARGGPVTVTHPEVERFLMTLPEAARLLLQVGTLEASGEIFVLELGRPVPILGLARNMIENSGLCPGRDIQIQITHLCRGEKLSEELFDQAREKLHPTPFDSIYGVQGQPFDFATFVKKLRDLEDAAWRESPSDIYRTLEELDIGFHPAKKRGSCAPKSESSTHEAVLHSR